MSITFSALPGVEFESHEAFDANVWQAMEIESALRDFEAKKDAPALYTRLSNQGCDPEEIVAMVAALPGRIGGRYPLGDTRARLIPER